MTRSRAGQILCVLVLTNLVSYAARNALFAVFPALHARFGIGDAGLFDDDTRSNELPSAITRARF